MTAVQARINGVLGVDVDNGIVAGFISFSVGLLVLVVVIPCIPSARRGAARLWRGVREGSIPFWMLLGGTCGALTVSTQGVTAGVLGVSLFTVGVVAGQTLHGLVLDRIGFGPAGVVAVTPGRLLGGVLALAAVGISLSGDVLATAPLWMLLLPFAAGVGIAWQAATNGRLAQRVQSPITATLMSFIAGTVALLIAAAVSILVRGAPQAPPAEPWLYLGGVLGFAYILLGAFIVAHTGVLLMGLGSVLGQLAASVVIDLIWPTASGPAPWQIAGMVVVAVASVVVAVPRRRRRTPATSSSSSSPSSSSPAPPPSAPASE
ncbi:MAG: DMT family transporter [Microbacterium sp.]|nr:DMT family transporter [Microbacterium sp.]